MNRELTAEQRSPEWFQSRLGKLTGSTFQKLMPTAKQGMNDWSETQLTILRQRAAELLTGEREDNYINKFMQWGIDNELNALRAFEDHEMTTVKECGLFLFNDDIGASPDGLLVFTEETWETKCPASKNHLRYYLDSSTLYEDYKYQCIGECLCVGYKKGVICSYDPRFQDDKKLVIHRFKPSEDDFNKLTARLLLAASIVKDMAGIEEDVIEAEFEEVQPVLEIEDREIIDIEFEKIPDNVELEIL